MQLALNPVDLRCSHNDFDIGPGLMQQRGRCERTLPPPYHDDVATREPTEVMVLRRVRGERRRQRGERCRAPSERGQPGSNDNPLHFQDLAILQQESEASPAGLDAYDTTLIQIGHGLALKPAPIVDEIIQWYWPRQLEIMGGLIRVERHGLVRIGDVRSFPGRDQEHALGHLSPPEPHRLAKHFDLYTG
jgi:hypothetical protein